jgi:hypothetical protein
VLLVMISKLAIDSWVFWTDRPPLEGFRLSVLAFGAITLTSAVHITRKLYLAAAAYFAVFIAASVQPEIVLVSMSAANLLVTLLVLWAWSVERRVA